MPLTTHAAPATNLRDAYRAFDPRPLASGDPYFVDLSPARESRAGEKLKKMIEFCDGTHAAIAFSGHRGSGKSTELLQLRQGLRDSCFGIYLNIVDYLDAFDLHYTDLFLLVARRVLDELREAGVELSANLLKEVEKWFSTVTKENEQSVELSAGVSTEAKAGVTIPFVAKLLAKLTADLKAGSSNKVTTRQEFDRYFSALLSYTNALLSEASSALQREGKPASILILLDNLDRVPPDKSEELVFTHGTQLQNLKCHAVYTISIDTYYSAQGIGNVFPRNVILPNVKMRKGKSDASENPAGVKAFTEIISRRIDPGAVLETPDLARRAALLSGGSARQLMRLMAEAILSASSRDLDAAMYVINIDLRA